MEIKWLEDFLCLVDTRNFSRSADQRATTQPAFSRRIKALEEWVGAILFDRSKQPISLTASGEQFRPVAEEIMRRLLQGREQIRQTGRETESTISFSATHGLSLTFFPDWIRKMEKRSGTLLTRLDSNQISYCVQALLRGESHFIICCTHPHVDMGLPEEFFISKKLGEDKLLPVSAPDKTGRPSQLLPGSIDTPLSYLDYTDTSVIGRAVEYTLANRSEKSYLNRVFESHLVAVLKTMSMEGRGLAWILETQIREELDTGTLVLSGDESWSIPIDISLFRSRDPLPQASENLWACAGDAE